MFNVTRTLPEIVLLSQKDIITDGVKTAYGQAADSIFQFFGRPNSALLNYLRVLQHQVLSNIYARSQNGIWADYWTKLRSPADSLIAEAYAQGLAELYRDLWAAERVLLMQYMDEFETYLNGAVENKTRLKSFATQRKNPPANPCRTFAYDSHSVQAMAIGYGSLAMNLGQESQLRQLGITALRNVLTHEPEWLNQAVTYPEYFMRERPDEAEEYRDLIHQSFHIIDEAASVQALIDSSDVNVFLQFGNVHLKHNRLSKAAGKNRVLMTDDTIPLPENATFLAWLCYTGIFAAEFTRVGRERMQQQYGVPFTHLFCLVLPSMPATSEHMNQGAVRDAASTATHSLPAASSGHKRLPNGFIDYGLWQAARIFLDKDSGAVKIHKMPLADIASHGLAVTQQLHATSQVNPLDRRWVRSIRGLNPSGSLLSCLVDPYQGIGYRLRFKEWDRQADMGMRSLAKMGVHFRFDSEADSETWLNAFASSAVSWLNDSPILRAAKSIKFQADQMLTQSLTQSTNQKKNAQAAFDLSALR